MHELTDGDGIMDVRTEEERSTGASLCIMSSEAGKKHLINWLIKY